jgi:2-polyprenyl-3-methyl-5-hydroxy-6-metoxy-1,4-benzoquinol methylase
MLRVSEQAQFIERPSCINCGSGNLGELSRGNYNAEPLSKFLAADPWGEDPAPSLQTAIWILSKCNSCAQVFHRRILNQEWNERRFSQWMSADAIKEFEVRLDPAFKRTFGAATHQVEHILRIEKLTRSLRSDDPVRLLDFGCGFGHFVEACKHFGFDACGVDRSTARRSEAAIEIHASLGDLSGQQFHAITLFEVLEHLDEPAKMLVQLSAHLVAGGILVLETPDCSGVTDIRSRADYLAIHPLEHINAFTHETLKSIAERTGFRHISRGPAFVTAESKRAFRRLGKHLLRKDGLSTQLYFIKT